MSTAFDLLQLLAIAASLRIKQHDHANQSFFLDLAKSLAGLTFAHLGEAAITNDCNARG
jgi:hypothetical protein